MKTLLVSILLFYVVIPCVNGMEVSPMKSNEEKGFVFSFKTPKIQVVPIKSDGGIVFSIKSEKKITGLGKVVVWLADSRETLWAINLNYFKGNKIEYGVLPKDSGSAGKGQVEQIFPVGETAKSVPQGELIYVYVRYNYDSFLGPAGAAYCFGFYSKSDGNIIYLGEQKYNPKVSRPDIY